MNCNYMPFKIVFSNKGLFTKITFEFKFFDSYMQWFFTILDIKCKNTILSQNLNYAEIIRSIRGHIDLKQLQNFFTILDNLRIFDIRSVHSGKHKIRRSNFLSPYKHGPYIFIFFPIPLIIEICFCIYKVLILTT